MFRGRSQATRDSTISRWSSKQGDSVRDSVAPSRASDGVSRGTYKYDDEAFDRTHDYEDDNDRFIEEDYENERRDPYSAYDAAEDVVEEEGIEKSIYSNDIGDEKREENPLSSDDEGEDGLPKKKKKRSKSKKKKKMKKKIKKLKKKLKKEAKAAGLISSDDEEEGGETEQEDTDLEGETDVEGEPQHGDVGGVASSDMEDFGKPEESPDVLTAANYMSDDSLDRMVEERSRYPRYTAMDDDDFNVVPGHDKYASGAAAATNTMQSPHPQSGYAATRNMMDDEDSNYSEPARWRSWDDGEEQAASSLPVLEAVIPVHQEAVVHQKTETEENTNPNKGVDDKKQIRKSFLGVFPPTPPAKSSGKYRNLLEKAQQSPPPPPPPSYSKKKSSRNADLITSLRSSEDEGSRSRIQNESFEFQNSFPHASRQKTSNKEQKERTPNKKAQKEQRTTTKVQANDVQSREEERERATKVQEVLKILELAENEPAPLLRRTNSDTSSLTDPVHPKQDRFRRQQQREPLHPLAVTEEDDRGGSFEQNSRPNIVQTTSKIEAAPSNQSSRSQRTEKIVDRVQLEKMDLVVSNEKLDRVRGEQSAETTAGEAPLREAEEERNQASGTVVATKPTERRQQQQAVVATKPTERRQQQQDNRNSSLPPTVPDRKQSKKPPPRKSTASRRSSKRRNSFANITTSLSPVVFGGSDSEDAGGGTEPRRRSMFSFRNKGSSDLDGPVVVITGSQTQPSRRSFRPVLDRAGTTLRALSPVALSSNLKGCLSQFVADPKSPISLSAYARPAFSPDPLSPRSNEKPPTAPLFSANDGSGANDDDDDAQNTRSESPALTPNPSAKREDEAKTPLVELEREKGVNESPTKSEGASDYQIELKTSSGSVPDWASTRPKTTIGNLTLPSPNTIGSRTMTGRRGRYSFGDDAGTKEALDSIPPTKALSTSSALASEGEGNHGRGWGAASRASMSEAQFQMMYNKSLVTAATDSFSSQPSVPAQLALSPAIQTSSQKASLSEPYEGVPAQTATTMDEKAWAEETPPTTQADVRVPSKMLGPSKRHTAELDEFSIPVIKEDEAPLVSCLKFYNLTTAATIAGVLISATDCSTTKQTHEAFEVQMLGQSLSRDEITAQRLLEETGQAASLPTKVPTKLEAAIAAPIVETVGEEESERMDREENNVEENASVGSGSKLGNAEGNASVGSESKRSWSLLKRNRKNTTNNGVLSASDSKDTKTDSNDGKNTIKTGEQPLNAIYEDEADESTLDAPEIAPSKSYIKEVTKMRLRLDDDSDIAKRRAATERAKRMAADTMPITSIAIPPVKAIVTTVGDTCDASESGSSADIEIAPTEETKEYSEYGERLFSPPSGDETNSNISYQEGFLNEADDIKGKPEPTATSTGGLHPQTQSWLNADVNPQTQSWLNADVGDVAPTSKITQTPTRTRKSSPTRTRKSSTRGVFGLFGRKAKETETKPGLPVVRAE